MTGFGVTSAQVRATGAQLDQLAQELRGQVANLNGQVEALLAGDWHGRAASGFATGWQHWQQGAEEVLSGLAAMAGLLGETAGQYEATESSTTGDVASSGAGL